MSKAEIRRLQARLDRLTPTLKKAVLRALESTRNAVTLARLVDAIERGDEFAIAALTGGLPGRLAKTAKPVTQAFVEGAKSASVSVKVGFNATAPAAIASAERHAASLVTGVTRETRNAIRAAVVRGFREQLPPKAIAALIKPVIGLSERQALAVVNRRLKQQAAGWTADRIAKDAERYAARLLKQRAEMIARTEIIRASTTGQITAWQQAQQAGRLSLTLRKTWIVTPDDKLCPICEPLDGQQVSVTEAFATDAGSVLGPPAHPNCRCAVGLTEATAARRRVA